MSMSLNRVLPLAFVLMLFSGTVTAAEPDAALVETYEQDAWVSAKDIDTQESYEAYLADYANGRHAKYAKAAINKIKKAEQPASAGAEESVVRKDGGAVAAVENPPVAAATHAVPAQAPPAPAVPQVAPAEVAATVQSAPSPVSAGSGK